MVDVFDGAMMRQNPLMHGPGLNVDVHTGIGKSNSLLSAARYCNLIVFHM